VKSKFGGNETLRFKWCPFLAIIGNEKPSESDWLAGVNGVKEPRTKVGG
jgi:hypothetical protein